MSAIDGKSYVDSLFELLDIKQVGSLTMIAMLTDQISRERILLSFTLT
jgi:hypothetical protein